MRANLSYRAQCRATYYYGGVQQLHALALALCFLAGASLVVRATEEENSWASSSLREEEALPHTQHPAGILHSGPVVEGARPQQEESCSTIRGTESVHTLSVPSNLSGISVPTVTTRESQRAGSNTGITILSAGNSTPPSIVEEASARATAPVASAPIPQQEDISVAPNEMESVSSLGDTTQAQSDLAVAPSAALAPLPTIREIPIPKRVGLYPVGPKVTGKSVLVNMAAMLSVYLNEEELEALDGWYDAQYADHLSRQNPFTGDNAAALPEVLDKALARFVTKDKLQVAFRAPLWRSIHDQMLVNDGREEYYTRISMPALRLARYAYEAQWGALSPSQVNTLYADEMQQYPVWDLVVGNRGGWQGRYSTIEERSELGIMEEVKHRLQPDPYKAQNEEDAVAALRVSWRCGTYILFQLPAREIVGSSASYFGEENRIYCRGTKEVIKAIKYVYANSSLPILLAVSYASEEAETLPNVEQVSMRMANLAVGISLRNIFFFEFGGILDIQHDDPYTMHQFNQWLAPGAENADTMERYCSARGGERSAVLEEITPRLPQLAVALKLRWAKNLTMTHKLLKRIYALNNQSGEQSRREAHTMYGTILEENIRVADAVELSPRVTFNQATKQLAGYGNLDVDHMHCIRLFARNQGTHEPLSYAADLRHNAESLKRDELFDAESDLPSDFEYIWEPKNPVQEEKRNGIIVRKHGTLTTILYPGSWLLWLGRKTRTERKTSRIRNFEEEGVAAHNTLSVLQAVNETPWENGQVGWLVLNSDLCAREMENKQVHEGQRTRLLEARTRSARDMIGRITGRHCTSEQLNASSLVIPREGYQCYRRETAVINDGNAQIQHTYWVYPESVDQRDFVNCLHRNNL